MKPVFVFSRSSTTEYPTIPAPTWAKRLSGAPQLLTRTKSIAESMDGALKVSWSNQLGYVNVKFEVNIF